jgi:hypothetical protein
MRRIDLAALEIDLAALEGAGLDDAEVEMFVVIKAKPESLARVVDEAVSIGQVAGNPVSRVSVNAGNTPTVKPLPIYAFVNAKFKQVATDSEVDLDFMMVKVELPVPGLSWSFAAGEIAIAGVISKADVFTYKVGVRNGSGAASVSGQIYVFAAPPRRDVHVGTAIEPIELTTTGGVVAGALELPSGILATWHGTHLTIGGTAPAHANDNEPKTYEYTVKASAGGYRRCNRHGRNNRVARAQNHRHGQIWWVSQKRSGRRRNPGHTTRNLRERGQRRRGAALWFERSWLWQSQWQDKN